MRTSGRLQRAFSPAPIRAGAILARDRCASICTRPTWSIPHHMLALERVLARAGRSRGAIT
jgi:hypothetical protein